MFVLAVILLGYISYNKLGIDLFPDLNNPRLFVELDAGEKPPEEMEKQFVRDVESLAIRQSDVTQVSSVSKVGVAQITVEYSWNKDMDDAFLDLQKAVTSYAQNHDDLDEVNITQHDPNSAPVVQLALTHPGMSNMNDLRKVAENYIRNKLVRLDGIAEVDVSGSQEEEVRIQTSPYKLDAFGLTLDNISTDISNFNESVSGGTISEMGMNYVVKGVSLLKNLDDFQHIIVGYKQQSASDTTISVPIYLQDVAQVSFSNKDPENIVRLNGNRCLGLSVYKETDFNTVKAVEQIKSALTDIRKALPGYQLTVVSNQGSFISSAISEVEESALIGILLAVIVLFVFLRRIGSTIIVSLAIPISIIATFNLMYFNHLTLNILTLGGLALGAGMLVDNAIVVLENIFRNHEEGMSVRQAAIEGTAQVGGAITASTITTIVVFLPIVYLHGSSGELFKDQAWTVAFSLLSSLVVAILVIPMLFDLTYRRKKIVVAKSIQLKGYGNFLKKLLIRRWLVVILTLVLMGIAALLVPFIGTEFMPRSGSHQFTMNVHMPEGTQLERTSAAMKNMETIIKETLASDVQTIFSQAGPDTDNSTDETNLFQGENTGTIQVSLNPGSQTTSADAVAAVDRQLGTIPGIDIQYKEDASALADILGTDEAPLVVEVQGDDLDEISNLALAVKTKMQHVDGIYNVESSMEKGAPEVELLVDRRRAGMYDLSVSSIVSQVKNQLEGVDAGQVERNGEMQDITLRLPDKNLEDLKNLKITSGTAEFRLDELAKIKIGQSPREIYRRNQNRIARVTAQLNKNIPLDIAARKIRASVSSIALPANYKITVGGEEQKRQSSMASLGFALLLSIVLVYMVLASEFESLLHPFTILLTIPLAVAGSVFLFFFTGQSFNMMAFIGIIMLVGIAVNDSIILVDRILQLQKGGLPRQEAIAQAGQQRIRPIIMTSLTTILALLPMTLGIGDSSALRSPMALAVVGGLFTSTILTLIVIPCVFELFEQLKERLHPVKKK